MCLRITLCQYETVLGNKGENVKLSLEWIDKAGEYKPDLIVLPELITTGYALGEEHLKLAETVPGPVTDLWSEKAREYGTYIIAGISRKDNKMDSIIYNSAVLISPEGNVTGIYSKVILPLYLHAWADQEAAPIFVEEAEIFRRGDSLPVFDTDFGKIGILICQDAVYPEFTRVLSMKGARLVVQLLNGPSVKTKHEDDITPLTTRVHAFDNNTFIALANRCGCEKYSYQGLNWSVTFHGESHIVDPFGNYAAKGKVEEEDLVLADIDLSQVQKAGWGTKFYRDWRPELLDTLTKSGVSLAE